MQPRIRDSCVVGRLRSISLANTDTDAPDTQ